MSQDVPLRCDCGQVRAVARGLSPSKGNRLVCYCNDCQAFAFYLDRAVDVLDEHGGTDIFQVAPCRIEILDGADQLRCIRLKERGLLRWFTACCRTPVGNTLGSIQSPFVGVILRFATK